MATSAAPFPFQAPRLFARLEESGIGTTFIRGLWPTGFGWPRVRIRLNLEFYILRIKSMKKLTALMTAALLLVVAWAPVAVAAKKTDARPVDFRACNYREGKTKQDLDKATEMFRNWANKNAVSYSAWLLTPETYSGDSFDVGWLGAWPNSVDYGVGMEKWKTPGNPVAAELNSVLDCSSGHEMAMSLPINAPDTTAEDGVLLFYQCSLNAGKSLADAYTAHLELGQTNKALGSLALSWMFTPAAGSGKIDFDYYYVIGFYRYSDMGATMEIFFNGGGAANREKILGPVASCRTPNGYDVENIRAADER